ncbi:MAG: hypothetical protein WC196_06780 [Bacilli bacterium]
MAAMTIKQLKEAIQELGFDINTRVVLLVGKTTDGKYQFVQVDENGKVVTTS